MENYVYMRKNEISDEKLKDIIAKIMEEKRELEEDFQLAVTERYIPVTYKGEEFYYDRRAIVLYPIFEKYKFIKLETDKATQEDIINYFPEELKNIQGITLMSLAQYRKTFHRERAKFIENGVIITPNQKMDCFLVTDGKRLKSIGIGMKEIKEGYVIPVIDLNVEGVSSEVFLKYIEKQLDFFEKNGIEPILDKAKLKAKYQRLKEVCRFINRYEIKDGKISHFNRNEILKDIDAGEFYYPLGEYKEKILNMEKERLNSDPYDIGIFSDSKRGHWDLFYKGNENIFQRDMIKIKVDEILYARDPEKDLKFGGSVAIDFGTKSTVVAFQENNDRKMFARIGGGSYKTAVEAHQYENPTVMEFIDMDSFLNDYRSFPGRPFTKWNDLKISHTAASDYLSGSSSVIEGLKQWCGNQNEYIIIHDKSGKKIKLKPYSTLEENDMDPLELYAYYIGSYINNMHTGNIFMDYLLSFPITYEQEVRNRILASFKRGIKKSLPISILKDEDLMEDFSVYNGTNEPTAYFLCAIREFGLLPKFGEKEFYGVFDFGGGTTDFDFGIIRNVSLPRYDYEIEHFGEDGDKYLGGENILNILSYEVFKKNKEILLKNNVTFYCPEGCSKFDGYENLLVDSYESKYNMKQMCEKLRKFWEEAEGAEEEYESGIIKIALMNVSGNMTPLFELDIDTEYLKELIRNRIENGIENFINALALAVKYSHVKDEIKNIKIFLAGNSSKHSYVKEIFDSKIAKYEEEIGKDDSDEKFFELYPPLGTIEAMEIQKKNGIKSSEEITGKTGVAYGLLEVREGGRIKIKAVDMMKNKQEANFKYFVGYASNGVLTVVLHPQKGYNKWIKFMDAGGKRTDIYYSNEPNAAEGNMNTSDKSIQRQIIKIDAINEDAYIYIRAKNVDTIEYVVAYEDEIESGKYVEGIKELKL